jgi:threonine dehydrogenase-like Zn-dependent dehydrogenase
MGSTLGGTVLALDNNSTTSPSHLRVGDTVFGFVSDGVGAQAGYQTYATVPINKISKLPPNLTLAEAVTVPCNLVTALHTLTQDLGLALPWPVPSKEDWVPREADEPILVWGAASSVGFYALQVLRHWGYRHVLAVASGKHHERLRGLGAKVCFDYGRADVVEDILGYLDGLKGVDAAAGPKVPFILDCIGSKEGTLRPLSKIAESGAKVAVMLPVINVHADKDQEPDYEMDVSKVLAGEWKDGVDLIGTRTHFYAEVSRPQTKFLASRHTANGHHSQNEFFRDHLQPEIVPALLEQGVVQPNRPRIVEGSTLLERAQNALDLLRDRAPSGEKLVWRVADEEN